MPGRRGTGEGDGADPPVLDERPAHLDVAGDELDAGGRQRPALAQQVNEVEGGQRGAGRGLDDHRAAGGDGGRDLVGGQQQRVVEAGDADDDADRAPGPEAQQALARREEVERHGLAVQASDLLDGRGERDEGARDLDLAVGQRFAGLQHQEPFELLGAGAQRVMRAEQGGAAGVGGQRGHGGGDGQRLLQGADGEGGVTERRPGHLGAVVGEDDPAGRGGRDPARTDRQPVWDVHDLLQVLAGKQPLTGKGTFTTGSVRSGRRRGRRGRPRGRWPPARRARPRG
ncbi:hypothetical protein GCM10009560_59030 [Nonomuraea longicatena]|uniref:Uncharacterized protein n=1 Tax=Nonomuraea longicatena TaxID=83682 RepID=A0ABP4B5E4_9ACTN